MKLGLKCMAMVGAVNLVSELQGEVPPILIKVK